MILLKIFLTAAVVSVILCLITTAFDGREHWFQFFFGLCLVFLAGALIALIWTAMP